MTWTISINGHDNLTDEEKAKCENEIVEMASELVTSLMDKEGVNVSTATCTTNTNGSVNLLST